MRSFIMVLLTLVLGVPTALASGPIALDSLGHPVSGLQYQKPGADIKLMNSATQKLNVGETQRVQLSLKTFASEGSMTINLKADTGLVLHNASTEYAVDLSALSSTQGLLELPVDLQVETEGQYLLHVFVTQIDGQGMQSSRAMALAIKTPNASFSQKVHAKAAGGVISMSANEVIE